MQVNIDYLQSFGRELNIDCSPKVTINQSKSGSRFADVPQSSNMCTDTNTVAVYVTEYSWCEQHNRFLLV